MPLSKKNNKNIFLKGFIPLEAALPKARLRPPRGDLLLTGFTLLELLIVLAILLIIIGSVVTRLNTSFVIQKLDSDSKKLASNISLAQQYATAQKDGHRYYGVVFYTGGYRIIPYDNPSIPLNPVRGPNSINETGDIPFSSGINVAGAQNIIFNYRGSTLLTNDISIVLSSGSSSKTIMVSKLTGSVSVN